MRFFGSYTNIAPETSQTLFRRVCLWVVDWLQPGLAEINYWATLLG